MKSATATRQTDSGSGKSARPSNASRKTGPKKGLYQKLMQTGGIDRPYSELSEREQHRLHDLRAMERRALDKGGKYSKLSRWVKSIRKRLGYSQPKFAKTVGVSVITIRRYECALGSYPSPQTMKRLKELAKMCQKLRGQKVNFND